PQFATQPYWASRVADLGIGTAHNGQTATTESLSAALKATLAPATRARASEVAGTIRTDGATVAASLLIERLSNATGKNSGGLPTPAVTQRVTQHHQDFPLFRGDHLAAQERVDL